MYVLVSIKTIVRQFRDSRACRILRELNILNETPLVFPLSSSPNQGSRLLAGCRLIAGEGTLRRRAGWVQRTAVGCPVGRKMGCQGNEQEHPCEEPGPGPGLQLSVPQVFEKCFTFLILDISLVRVSFH